MVLNMVANRVDDDLPNTRSAIKRLENDACTKHDSNENKAKDERKKKTKEKSEHTKHVTDEQVVLLAHALVAQREAEGVGGSQA